MIILWNRLFRIRGKSSVIPVIFAVMLGCIACGHRADADAAGKSAGVQTETEINSRKEMQDSKIGGGQEKGELQVHFIDVGQGDATLIVCDGHAMMFDMGENDKGTAVQFYLMEQGIDRLDYVIGSHPESDHIGGMDVILTKYDCDCIMLPDVQVKTATYRDVLSAVEYKNYKITLPKAGDTYQLGSAYFTVIAPNHYDYGGNVNNCSIGIRLVHGENVFLFTGDAEAEAETDILSNGLEIKADVLKVGHHGSHDATSRAFAEAVSPAYAVISCGKENEYGHPHRETLNTLEAVGAEIYRTDEQGTIIAFSDGKSITWSIKQPEEWQEIYYVGNKTNGKLHLSVCESLPKEWNQVIFETKEEAVEAGFSDFCGGCRP